MRNRPLKNELLLFYGFPNPQCTKSWFIFCPSFLSFLPKWLNVAHEMLHMNTDLQWIVYIHNLELFMLRHQFNMINFKHPLVFSYLFMLVDNFMSSYDWLIYFSHFYLMNFCLELKFLLFPVKYTTLYFLVPDFILFLLLCCHLVLSYDTLILLCINDTTWFYRDTNSQTYIYFFSWS